MPRGFWRSQGESIRTEEDKDSFDRLFLGGFGFVFVEKGVSDLEILGVAQSCGFPSGWSLPSFQLSGLARSLVAPDVQGWGFAARSATEGRQPMGRLAFWANREDVRIGRGRCLYVGLCLAQGKGGDKLPLVSELKVSLCEIYFWVGRGDGMG
jgi:hypothetical protein